jgi:hypothetical protein
MPAEMSSVQLRVRIRAYGREKASAANHVANQLAGTPLGAETPLPSAPSRTQPLRDLDGYV